MEELYHHGVKGQKWGVRRYKDVRGRAINQQKLKDRASSKKYRSEVKVERQNAKTEKATFKRIGKELQRDINPSSRNERRVNKALIKETKQLNKLQNAKTNRKIKSKDYNKAAYQYQKLVDEAAKLPVNIKITPKRSKAKKALQNATTILATQAIASYGGIDVTPRTVMAYSSNKTPYTRNDRFASSVNNAQIRNHVKKQK